MIKLLIAMILDYIIGDPLSWPHPVIYIGKLIKKIENIFLKSRHKKLSGLFMVIVVLLVVYFVTELLCFMASFNTYIYWGIMIYGLYAALAYRALIKAADTVYEQLASHNLKEARIKLSYIVGRDIEHLNEEQIIKATIETVAENTIDGIIAPLFYAVLGQIICGNPVHFIWVYKAINTMDSMVGYMNDKYKDFGYVAAKLDDMANFIPARLGSLFMLLAGGLLSLDIRQAFKIYRRDRMNHKSPNSGHSESVVAGFLNIQLGGENTYFGQLVAKPTIGIAARQVSLEDIKKTQNIVFVTYLLTFIMIGLYIGVKWFYGI